jgi:hypothetical protein
MRKHPQIVPEDAQPPLSHAYPARHGQKERQHQREIGPRHRGQVSECSKRHELTDENLAGVLSGVWVSTEGCQRYHRRFFHR